MKKKLLIITQKVDKADPVLGFFHRWLEEFSKHWDQLTVISLFRGETELPSNVRTLSLGKEKGFSRSKYVYLFLKYIWQERKNYDAVFVHMNQEYVLLGGIFWRLFGFPVYLWRNHPRGSLLTKLAIVLSTKVFCTSRESFTAPFPKTQLMPVGIDTDFFSPREAVNKKDRSILFLSRISPIKKPDILIRAFALLRNRGQKFEACLVGDCLPTDRGYYNNLKEEVKRESLDNFVEFKPAVPNYETPNYYNSFRLSVNLTPSGSLDKTIFEAMSCEQPVLTSNLFFKGLIDDDLVFTEGQIEDLTTKIEKFLNLDNERQKQQGKELRDYVVKNHSLKLLAQKLSSVIR